MTSCIENVLDGLSLTYCIVVCEVKYLHAETAGGSGFGNIGVSEMHPPVAIALMTLDTSRLPCNDVPSHAIYTANTLSQHGTESISSAIRLDLVDASASLASVQAVR